MPQIRHTSSIVFGLCLTRALRLSAVATLFAGWALAVTGPQPNFYARREYGNGAPGCAGPIYLQVADINGDGIPDILCNGSQYLYGKGDGTYILSQDYSALSGGDFRVLDLNGDGNPDLVATAKSGDTWGLHVAFGNGKGTFGTPTFYSIGDTEDLYLAVGDFNGDGIPDVVTLGEQGVWLMTGKGNGLFNQPILAVPGVGDFEYRFRAADMNDDGKLDLIVSIQSGISILFGNGDGTFQAPVTYNTPIRGANVTVADINGDGYLDVLCSSTSDSLVVTIFPGERGGVLGTSYNLELPNYEDVEVGDVNGDGIPDLVSDSVYVAYGKGNGAFTKPVYFAAGTGSTVIVLAHLRSPKLLDLVTNDAFYAVTVLLNNGKGQYIEGITTPLPSGLVCTTELDYNNDGIPDLGFIQNSTTFLVEYGTGKIGAPFAAGPSSPIPVKSGYTLGCPSNPGDINGDGIPDLIIPEINASATNTLLYPFFGTGDGSFTAGAPVTFAGNQTYVNLVDVNGDGKADLITPTTNQIWYGNGNGTFQAPVMLASGVNNEITDVAWADLNGDGKLDFVVQVEDGIQTIVLLSNASGGFSQTSMNEAPSPWSALLIASGSGVLEVIRTRWESPS